MKACGSRWPREAGVAVAAGVAAERGCEGTDAGGWGLRPGGGAKLGAEPLGPVNPTCAVAPDKDAVKSANAQSRAAVRTGSIGSFSLGLRAIARPCHAAPIAAAI